MYDVLAKIQIVSKKATRGLIYKVSESNTQRIAHISVKRFTALRPMHK
jgi:hypothetical protein